MFRALEQLYALGALNDKGELTTLGELNNICLLSGTRQLGLHLQNRPRRSDG